MSPDLISLTAGTAVGFLTKMSDQSAKHRHEERLAALDSRKEADKSANQAAERAKGSAGNWVRRFIVVSILLSSVGALMIMPFLGQDVVVMVEQQRGWLGRIFNSDTRITFETVKGFLLIPETRQALLAVIGYYLGRAK